MIKKKLTHMPRDWAQKIKQAGQITDSQQRLRYIQRTFPADGVGWNLRNIAMMQWFKSHPVQQRQALFFKITPVSLRGSLMAEHAGSIRSPRTRKRFIESIEDEDSRSSAMMEFATTLSDASERLAYLLTIPTMYYRDEGIAELA
ncbi:MAG: hypothetical protein FJ308_24210, partial [Planctomycetes bacterium]|nr:hypothetical protein [Planctomycetota bacterium]